MTVERDGWAAFTVDGSQRYHSPGVIHVEGDASSARIFWRLAAFGRGPGGWRRAAAAFRAMCALPTRWPPSAPTSAGATTGSEARGTGRVKAFDADFNHIPDAAMTLAVAALADGRSVLRNIGSWRSKETDRIAAMAAELRTKVGAVVEEGEDWPSPRQQ